MPGRIFINYRRGDEPGFALALYGRLEQAFSAAQLFMDVEGGIPAGDDFVQVLQEQVAQCDVLLALIGQGWLAAKDDTGASRLDNPDDFVRVEIELAMRLGKRIIPVLINRAEMPRGVDMPEPLRPLSRRNAVRLTQERFRADTQGLIAALEGALREAEAAREAARKASIEANLRQQREQQDWAAERALAEQARRDAAKSISAEQPAKPERAAKRTGSTPRVASREFIWDIGIAFASIAMLPLMQRLSLPIASISLIIPYAVAALSLAFLMRCGGPASAGHAAPFAIGAFAVAVFVHQGASLPVAMGGAVLVSACFAALTGLAVAALRGIYAVVATLLIGALASLASFPLFGAAGVYFQSSISSASLILLAFLVATYVLLFAAEHFLFSAWRQRNVAGAIWGTSNSAPGYAVRLAVYTISGAFCGLGGSLYGMIYQYVAPELFDWRVSILLLAASLLGGLRFLSGSIFGTAVIWIIVTFAAAYSELAFAFIPLLLLALSLLIYVGPAELIGAIKRNTSRQD